MKRDQNKPTVFFIFAAISLTIIAWLAAAVVALFPILSRLLGNSRFQSPGLESTSQWLLEGYRVIILGGILLAAGFLFLFLARYLILRQNRWRNSACCPVCGEDELVRVPRRRLVRTASSLLSLPLGRYLCRSCRWRGVRLIEDDWGWGAEMPARKAVDSAGSRSLLVQALVVSKAEALEAPMTSKQGLGFDPVRHSSNPRFDAGQQAMGSTTITMPQSQIELAADSKSFARAWAETLPDYANRPLFVAVTYLAALTVAEIVSVLLAPTVGVILHLITLFILLMHAAFTWEKPIHRFLLALTLVPLIRVISLSLPLVGFTLPYWFFITSVPLFAAAYVVMRQLNFAWRDLGLSWRSLPLQLAIGLTGIIFGIVEYFILEPEPLVESFTWQQIWLPATILFISTGFLEEYIFRFLMQRNAVERLGALMGIIYVALFFAVLHIGYRSAADFLFVLVVGLFFGLAAWRTRSIVGVTISHGLTNIMLFLVVPFVILGSSSTPLDNARSLLEDNVTALSAETALTLSAPLPEAEKVALEDQEPSEEITQEKYTGDIQMGAGFTFRIVNYVTTSAP